MKNKTTSTILFVVAILFFIASISLLNDGEFESFFVGLAISSICAFIGWSEKKKEKKIEERIRQIMSQTNPAQKTFESKVTNVSELSKNTYNSDISENNTKYQQSNVTVKQETDEAEISSPLRAKTQFIKEKEIAFDAELESIPRVEIIIDAQAKKKKQPASSMPFIKYSNITKKTNLEKLFPFVVIDVETTGLKPRENDIIELSAIKFDKDYVPIDCFTTLLKPSKPIPAEVTNINGITDDMVANSPTFAEVADSFSKYITGCNIVGHNLSFDLKFLYVCGLDLPSKVKYYDTLELAKLVLKGPKRKYDKQFDFYYWDDENVDVENYKLETLCDYYFIYRSVAHRSLSDCLATAKLFRNLVFEKM